MLSVLAGVLSLPVLESLLAAVAGIHALLSRGPLAGADLTMLLIVLESLDEAEDLVHITTDGEIVELHVSEDTLAIDDEGCTEVECIISSEAAIVTAELLGQVGEHWDLHPTEATLVTRLVGKLLVSKVRINGCSNHLAVYILRIQSYSYCSL